MYNTVTKFSFRREPGTESHSIPDMSDCNHRCQSAQCSYAQLSSPRRHFKIQEQFSDISRSFKEHIRRFQDVLDKFNEDSIRKSMHSFPP